METSYLRMEWKEVKLPREDCPQPMGYHSASVVNGNIYLFGGYDGSHRYTNDIYYLQAQKKQWKRPKMTGPRPPPRGCHSASVVGTKIYIFGGQGRKRRFNDLHVFDTQQHKWETVLASGPTPKPRNSHSAAVIGKNIYIYGGYDGSSLLNDMFIFDTETQSWSAAKTKEGNAPPKCSAHTSCAVDGKLYLFGGRDGTRCYNDIFVFDPPTSTWTKPDVTGEKPVPVYRLKAAVLRHRFIVFVGGFDEVKCSNSTYMYDTLKKNWQPIHVRGPLPEPSCYHATAVISNEVYLLGGLNDAHKYISLRSVFLLSIREHILPNTFSRWLNNPHLADIVIPIKDGQSIHAHYALLCARNEAFADVVKSNPEKFDLDESLWLSLLTYCYCDEIPVKDLNNIKVILKLYAIAEEYKFIELAEECKWIIKQCTGFWSLQSLESAVADMDYSSEELSAYINWRRYKFDNKNAQNKKPPSKLENPFEKAQKTSTLSRGIEKLLLEDDLRKKTSDVSIIIEDTDHEPLQAHKIVLASMSEYFNGMFMNQMLESQNGVVDFKSIKVAASTLKIILQYIYLGTEPLKLDLSDTDWARLFEVSHLLSLGTFYTELTVGIGKNVNASNIWELLSFADTYDLAGVQQACFNFMMRHSDIIAGTLKKGVASETTLIRLLKQFNAAKST